MFHYFHTTAATTSPRLVRMLQSSRSDSQWLFNLAWNFQIAKSTGRQWLQLLCKYKKRTMYFGLEVSIFISHCINHKMKTGLEGTSNHDQINLQIQHSQLLLEKAQAHLCVKSCASWGMRGCVLHCVGGVRLCMIKDNEGFIILLPQNPHSLSHRSLLNQSPSPAWFQVVKKTVLPVTDWARLADCTWLSSDAFRGCAFRPSPVRTPVPLPPALRTSRPAGHEGQQRGDVEQAPAQATSIHHSWQQDIQHTQHRPWKVIDSSSLLSIFQP